MQRTGSRRLHSHNRARGDRGATLVEAAVVTPVLLLIIFGIFEFGFFFRNYLAVSNGARDGAREASVAANVADADYRVMRAIERATAALPDGAIELIKVYEATDPEDRASDVGCGGSSSVLGVCNVYTASDLTRDVTQWGCQTTAAGDPVDSPDRFWCPTDREVSIGTGLDYVGVEITVTHDYITGLFGSSNTFDDYIVLKVEPQSNA